MSARLHARTAMAWLRARRLEAMTDAQQLARLQQRWLVRHLDYVAAHSPFYRAQAGQPLTQWPVLRKAEWLAHFDTINTVGARLPALEQIALQAERSRDFAPQWGAFTVGLSTGTSGRRGLFVVSPQERADWAGTLLGRVLREPWWSAQRIALVLRAGSTLYESVRVARLQFRYFDPLRPWEQLRQSLADFDPTILVAPAQLLARLAEDPAALRPRRVISVAEVLEDLDRARITARWGVPVEQIYQATEGFLGSSCAHGSIHLNEPWLLVEREWQDAARTRFVPVVTDLFRRAQPVIRYRLDDVLRIAPQPCPCGRASTAVEAIEGRCDDVLLLPGRTGERPVFADQIARQIVCAVPGLRDYEVVETRRGHWRVGTEPAPDAAMARQIGTALEAMARQLGAEAPQLQFTPVEPATDPLRKRRRIRGAQRA